MNGGTSCGCAGPAGGPGVMRAAVEAHHAEAPVIFEAEALDRELSAERSDWPALLRAGTAFAQHYIAVLLHSTAALGALGEAFLAGACRAPSPELRLRFALALLSLIDQALEEAEREGPRRVPHVPQSCGRLLRELGGCQEALHDPGRLLVPLNLLGRRVLRVADEGQPVEDWFWLLDRIVDLLLANTRARLRGEPSYDGRWDASPERDRLHLGLLDPVRRERLDEDLGWLEHLASPGERTPARAVEVFLDLSSYQRRDRRAAAWDQWLNAVAGEVAAATIAPRLLLDLCRAIAEWIEHTRDRRFLGRLAASLQAVAPEILRRQDAAGLSAFFRTVGQAAVRRLEAEAGRGEIDAALRDLCSLLHRALRQIESREVRERVGAQDLALRARLGPVLGRPLAPEDLGEVLAWAEERRAESGPLLRRVIVGVMLEECVFSTEADAPGPRDLLPRLAGLLSLPWEHSLRHTVRALLRLAPLSPFHLGEPGVRTLLVALEPSSRPDSFLSDMQREVLTQPLPRARRAVEQVLRFVQCGDAAALDGLASPESVFALPRTAEKLRISDMRCALRTLARCVPGGSETSVAWLAELPPLYQDPRTLSKLAGFDGCAPLALEKLALLIGLYRALRPRRALPLPPAGDEAFDLARASRCLLARREIQHAFFRADGTPGSDPAERLDTLAQDLQLQRELADSLSGWRALPLSRQNLDPLLDALGLLMQSARLSGLGGPEAETEQAWRAAVGGDLPRALRRWLSAFTALRNQAAADYLPHVQDSLRRLRANPLARPAEAFRGLIDDCGAAVLEEAATRLDDAVCEDLFYADGGLPIILDLVQRLIHLLEML